MEAAQVLRDDGQQGTMVQRMTTAEAAPQLVIALADGSQLVVPEEGRIAQPDGTYHLRRHSTARVQEVTTASGVDAPLVVPVVAEELTVETRQVIRGTVRMYTRVETRQEVVDEPLRREDVAVECVPVHALVEGGAPMPKEHTPRIFSARAFR